jgi:hypothetical protein
MRYSVPALTILGLLLLGGCSQSGEMTAARSMQEQSDMAAAPAADSLFKADQAVLSNQDIDKILAAKVYPPAHARVAVVRIGGRYPWGHTWWSQSVAQIEQKGADQLLNAFRSTPRVAKVMMLPSMLMPVQTTVPYLREAAARVQADTLLVYRTYTQTYQKERFFGGGTVHAYATVEAVLLDVRSGIITDTAVKTESFSAPKSSKDVQFDETAARAEQTAIADALGQAARDLAGNLAREPMPASSTTKGAPRP